ncbi:hypothetical protein AJ80_01094 [Polytolypa hystricis UAMH7299]|uniref:Uncharacterized protein n=1 Tax=Polytolypa hystricis (strain UAMH7299) TaxID=1447883 RepID=A0A2B7Z1Y3_POLH7|nr:hypothetical protein AJ80_01094 [Polytolypa hystricis UAMH7299]
MRQTNLSKDRFKRIGQSALSEGRKEGVGKECMNPTAAAGHASLSIVPLEVLEGEISGAQTVHIHHQVIVYDIFLGYPIAELVYALVRNWVLKSL